MGVIIDIPARVVLILSLSPVLTQFRCCPPQLLQQLYEGDVLSEEALLSWAAEKEHADDSDKVYLLKVRVGGGEASGSWANYFVPGVNPSSSGASLSSSALHRPRSSSSGFKLKTMTTMKRMRTKQCCRW